ncbi:MAG: magnesium chelatase domain-containing protein, partial [Cyclobacteriaceae bacterium]
MVSKTYGAAVLGVEAHVVTIEVSVGQGLYFFMSGLPDNAVKQSEHRMTAALQAMGFEMPRNKVIVNLAPADMRKEGSSYDLAIALAMLRSSGQVAD